MRDHRPKNLILIESNSNFLNVIPVAKVMGYSVVFVYAPHNEHIYGTDAKRFLQDVTKIPVQDSTCAEEIINQLESHGINHADIVLQGIEVSLEAAAEVARHYRTPFTASEGIANSRDKARARELLADIDPVSILRIHDQADVDFAKQSFHFPAFLKPTRGTASIGAKKVEDHQALVKAWKDILDQRERTTSLLWHGDFLLETYLEGRMISVEVGVIEKDIKIFMIDERRRSSEREAVETGTVMPAHLSPMDSQEISSFVHRVIERLGLERGVFHIELMLTRQGPKLIEVNPRLMGGSLPLLFQYSTGVDIFRYVLEAFSQKQFSEFKPERSGYAVSRIFGAKKSGRLHEQWDLTRLDSFQKEHDLLFKFFKRSGENVQGLETNFDYIGYFFVRSRTPEEGHQLCEKVLDELEKILGVDLLR